MKRWPPSSQVWQVSGSEGGGLDEMHRKRAMWRGKGHVFPSVEGWYLVFYCCVNFGGKKKKKKDLVRRGHKKNYCTIRHERRARLIYIHIIDKRSLYMG